MTWFVWRELFRRAFGVRLAKAPRAALGRDRMTLEDRLTPAATPVASMVADINPGANGSFPTYPTQELTEFKGKLYFSARTDTVGFELFATDLKTGTTAMVADIYPGAYQYNGNSYPYSSYPAYFTSFKGKLYFTAASPTGGRELWSTDGKSAPTQVADINPGANGSYPNGFAVIKNKLYFAATDVTNGRELWVTDGKTAPTKLPDINPGAHGSYPAFLTPVGTKIYFQAFTDTAGAELFALDTKTGTTTMVSDLYPGAYQYNGNSYPYSSYPAYLTVSKGKVYFSAFTKTSGRELWVSDPKTGQTTMVADIYPGAYQYNGNSYPYSSYPNQLTDLKGKLFFAATTKTSGRELWSTDTKTGTTAQVADINPGTNSGYPLQLTVFKNKLYFTVDDGTHGQELWKADGKNAPSMVADINPGAPRGIPYFLAPVGGKLYFLGTNGTQGYEVWRFDGKKPPNQVADINPGANGSLPYAFTLVKGDVYFSADDGTHGRELWKIDHP